MADPQAPPGAQLPAPSSPLGLRLAQVGAGTVTLVVNGLAIGAWAISGMGFFWPVFVFAATTFALGTGALVGRRARAPAAPPVPAAPARAEDPFFARVRALCDVFRKKGQGALADALLHGMQEADALANFRSDLGDVSAAIAESRRDAAALRTRAAASKDAEARESWLAAATTAQSRQTSLEAILTEEERANARIQAFRQQVKSLETEAARLGLGDGADALAELRAHKDRLTREVEAMSRTKQELRRLSQVR